MRPPAIHLRIDRTSFDETDDFSIAPLKTYEPPKGKSIKMKNGKVRRKMRWRILNKDVVENCNETQQTRSPHRKRPHYVDRFLPVESIETKSYEQLSPKTTVLHEKDDNSSLDDIRNAMSNHFETCEDQKKCYKREPLQVEQNLQAIHDMATEHLRQGEYDEALEVFEEIVRGLLTRYGDSHPRVGTAYHNRGIVQMRLGQYDAATQSYQQAIRIRKTTLGDDHADVATSLAQLGVAHLEQHQPRKALVAFREALHLRRQWYGNDHLKVAKILHNIGCALYELNELEMAKVAWEEALKIQRVALKSSASEAPLLGIAATQWNLASLQLSQGAYDDAAVLLEEVLLVQECVLSEQDPLVQQTRDTLEWLNQQPSSVLMNFERRLLAMRDLACGAAAAPMESDNDSLSIAGS
ncbi:kinesin light chain [Fistulifera solaris]|uniref:Kinesin light chain n=1 Tax=Fistulifera solaris TaxID=1519565 RepID=A0A1Z5JUZ7_FISSO|nr:kinesin light chain [Fistulifera solaris]|eukprot:GAX17865.1 kinesin light chain [Fistulifera solaris]